jgi:hypothetical protein
MMANDRFDKFSQPARRVLALAQEEAQSLNNNYIGTEHLLLGLVREEDGGAAKVLHPLGIDLDQVRDRVGFIIGRGDRAPTGEIGLTPRARAVIELAVDESRRLGHRVVGTEHLLLGLLREGQGIGVGVLESLGVNVETLRLRTIAIVGQGEGLPAVDAARLAEVEELSAAFGERPSRGPDLGGLRRVRALGRAYALGDRPVTALALEDYERGFVLTLLLPATDPSPDAPFVSAGDDRGVGYLVVHGNRGVQGDVWRYALTLRPALDPAARQLRLRAAPEQSGDRTLVIALPQA